MGIGRFGGRPVSGRIGPGTKMEGSIMRTLAALGHGLWICALAFAGPLQAQSGKEDPWPSLAADIFDGKPIADANGIVALEAPYRAEDAALVPLTIRTKLPDGDSRFVRKLTLVIDGNPSPVAAEFTFGPKAAVDELTTRVRVDTYTNIHVVAELSDGALYGTGKFVKASGGCSAPAGKNPDEAMASLGKMRLRQFAVPADEMGKDRREVQLMIRHPNNSGLQMDQVTRNYVPLYIVRELTVRQGGDLVMKMEGGISISEDPNFRFRFTSNGADRIEVEAEDTSGKVFKGDWKLEAQPSGS